MPEQIDSVQIKRQKENGKQRGSSGLLSERDISQQEKSADKQKRNHAAVDVRRPPGMLVIVKTGKEKFCEKA